MTHDHHSRYLEAQVSQYFLKYFSKSASKMIDITCPLERKYFIKEEERESYFDMKLKQECRPDTSYEGKRLKDLMWINDTGTRVINQDA